MPAATALPRRTPERPAAGESWRALGVQVDVLVTEPTALPAARTVVERELAALDRACSRFRPDSEVRALQAAGGRPVPVSPLLAEAVRVALEAAEKTGGDVDPTLGTTLCALGYDRDFASLTSGTLRIARRAGWRDVRLHPSGVLRVPDGVLLDLGATAKALGADRCARLVASTLGCGVLVNLGGNLSVAGPAPDGGWAVRVQDRPGSEPDGPHETVAVRTGGLATSSSTARRWQRGGRPMHHLIDPRSGLPARSPWRTVTVAAGDCVQANTASTCAIVRGAGAVPYLLGLGVAARLVAEQGSVQVLGDWPSP